MPSISAIPELRAQAESRLKTLAAFQGHTTADPARLVHELQVHQIELQMQNEVLAETLSQCETLRMKYQDLYDFAPVSYLTLSTMGGIVECNRSASRLLGLTRGQLANRRFQDFFSPDSLVAVQQLMESICSSESMDEMDARNLKLLDAKPLQRYVNAQGRVYIDHASGVQRIRMVLMDVTSLKLATDDVVKAISQFGDL